jgi:nitroreductase
MDVYEAIRSRRSVRSYQDKAIPEEVLNRVLDAARMAPSANNVQPWKFIIVKDGKLRRETAKHCWNQTFLAEAPVIIVACGLPTTSKVGGYESSVYVDVAIAVDHLTLAARAEGLGTCWIGAFDNEKLKNLLNIPKEVNVVVVTPLGYPKGPFGTMGYRKEGNEITSVDGYGE